MNAILVSDVDGDGRSDIILAGNSDRAPEIEGPYDASFGSLLLQREDGSFDPVGPAKSGLWLHGNINGLAWLRKSYGRRVLVTPRNDDGLQLPELADY